MSLFNVSAPTIAQWKKVLKATLFAFGSTFLATLLTAGGLHDSVEATIALVLSAAVAATNAALYALYITLFKSNGEG